MARYSKAIGATVGAVALWFAAFGVQSIGGVDLGHLFELLATFLGSGIGAYVAPRNA
jgi:hypothetical protein